jgi:imidazolonepropionase-like amidohydrolase
MSLSICLRTLAAVTLCFAPAGFGQVPANQLMKPPDAAQKFVVVSTAGQHGTSALWKSSDGSVLSRESVLLRGMVWEQDEAIHLGPNGQPDRITIRGVTPFGDAAETFIIDDREARWKTPVDSGALAYDKQAHYYPYGGTMTATAVLAEKLYAAQGRKLALLPAGEARLERLASLAVGDGSARRTVWVYAIDGLSLDPQPVWLDDNGKFFASVSSGAGLSVVPEGYESSLQKLLIGQDDALASRSAAIAKRFGSVPATPVAFTNVRLFDSKGGRFVENQTVVADKGRIIAVGSASTTLPASGTRVIDGAGKTLLPGLWDSHMHVDNDFTGPMLLSLGVTSARDPGSPVEGTLSRKGRIRKGELLFPSVYPSVLIDGKGPLAAQAGVAVDSAQSAIAAVRMASDKGFTGVKFYGSMKPDWLIPAIAEAKKLGLHVHGHIPAGMRPAEAIAAGYDEITHINMVMMQAMPDDVVSVSNGMQRFEGPGRYARNIDIGAEPIKSLIQEMADRHIASDPTLVAFESLYVPENGELSAAYRPFVGTLPPVTERYFLAGGYTVPAGLTRADYRASFRKLMMLAQALHKANVPIVAGTDGSGLEIVRELELYVEAGFSPAEALQTATINPARLVKADATTGSITVGKTADMVLVDGDPSKHIGDARRTVWVMSAGRLINADELRGAVGFTGPPH